MLAKYINHVKAEINKILSELFRKMQNKGEKFSISEDKV